MAYSLFSGKIIDCLGSRDDLANKKIRMVSKKSFIKDPLRLIRAYRIGAQLGFEIEHQTAATINNNIKLIRNSAVERIKAELFKMFAVQKSHHYLSQMASVGLLFEIFPELVGLKGCLQNRYHRYDVFEHTMKAFYHLEKLLHEYCNIIFSSTCSDLTGSDLAGSLDNESRRALLKCAILLHDIGKPMARTVDNKGKVHFYGHEKKGADIAMITSKRLKFSNREKDYLDFIIRNHMRPIFLFIAHMEKRLTRNNLTRFFMRCGDNTPDLMLHAIADIKGKENKSADEFMAFAKNIIHDFFSGFKQKKLKPPLITGYDLIDEFALTPSPLFRTILNRVEEARLSGKIKTKKQAIGSVKKFITAHLKGQGNRV